MRSLPLKKQKQKQKLKQNMIPLYTDI